MSVSSTLKFLPAAESSDAPGGPGTALPGSGNSSIGNSNLLENGASETASSQDEVKVQVNPPAEIPVYQFVNQQGVLVLQVPPQAMLNIAHDISQEQTQEAITEKSAANEGGKDHGD
jgi:hypothetical protein